MAEVFLLRRQLRVRDPEAAAKAYAEADVVSIHEDGTRWGSWDMSTPHGRIVRVTASVLDLEVLTRMEVDETSGTAAIARRRAYRIDITRLPPAARAWWDDDSRSVPILDVQATRAQVLGWIAQKTPLVSRLIKV